MNSFLKKYWPEVGTILFVIISLTLNCFLILNQRTTVGFSNTYNALPFRVLTNGKVGIGTTTPTAVLQATIETSNATTSIEFGKAGQNKGTCLTVYNVAGEASYCSVSGTTWSCSTISCN